MTKNAQRQSAHRARMAERGFVQCNVWVPAHAVADFKRAAELAAVNPDLTIARMVDIRSGKLVGMKGCKQ